MTDLAEEYGKGLYDLTEEEHVSEDVLAQLRVLKGLFRDQPDFIRLLCNMSLAKEERTAILDGALRGQVHPYVLNFLKILCERGMLASLPSCCDEYRDSLYEARGILPVTAWTAAPLDEKQTKALTEKLEKTTGKQVLLTCRTDASLLGGVRLSYAGRELDGTVKGRLDKLREILTD